MWARIVGIEILMLFSLSITFGIAKKYKLSFTTTKGFWQCALSMALTAFVLMLVWNIFIHPFIFHTPPGWYSTFWGTNRILYCQAFENI